MVMKHRLRACQSSPPFACSTEARTDHHCMLLLLSPAKSCINYCTARSCGADKHHIARLFAGKSASPPARYSSRVTDRRRPQPPIRWPLASSTALPSDTEAHHRNSHNSPSRLHLHWLYVNRPSIGRISAKYIAFFQSACDLVRYGSIPGARHLVAIVHALHSALHLQKSLARQRRPHLGALAMGSRYFA